MIRTLFLKDRSLLKITGEDSYKFLHGIVTSDLSDLKEEFKYTFFLNSQGRFLFDAFIYREDTKSFIIDHHKSITNDLVKHLKFYKLRSKFDIIYLNEHHVIVSTGPREADNYTSFLNRSREISKNNQHLQSYFALDSRSIELGYRSIYPSKLLHYFLSSNTNEFDVSIKDSSIISNGDKMYKSYRFSLGIAEGPFEIFKNHSLPLEYNLDLLNGVSFNKGCYLGQELTTRTYWSGIVRKRVLPFHIENYYNSKEDENSPKNYGALIREKMSSPLKIVTIDEMAQNKLNDVGKLIDYDESSNYLLALTRLPNLPTHLDTEYFIVDDQINFKIPCKLHVPSWFNKIIQK